LKKSKILLNIIFSSFWAQLIMVFGSIVFARIYNPSCFGTLAYLSGFASIIAIISGLRFDYIVFSKKNNEKSLYNITSFIVMFILHLLFIIVVSGIDLFSNFVDDKIYWIIFFSFSSSLFYLSTQLLISIQEYSLFSKTRILQAILQLFFGFFFFFMDSSVGLILAYSISQLIVGLLICYTKAVVKLNFEYIKDCFFKNYREATYNTTIILIQYSTPFAPILIGNYLYNSDDVGAFFLLSSAFSAPFAIFRRSLVNLFNGELTSPDRAKVVVGKTKNKGLILLVLLLVLLLGMLIIYFFSIDIIFLVFGEHWVGYSKYILPIFVFFYLDMIFQPFTTLLPLWGNQNYSMFLEIIRFSLVYLVLPFFAKLLGLNYLNYLVAYFILSTCIYLLNIFKVYTCTISHLKIN
jgi:O-antigen/teichoic acid export membrane protein